MPTLNPRITFTVSPKMMKQIEEYRFENRIRNQTQAIVDLINLGLESLSDKPAPRFTEEELELIELYQCAEQHSKDNAILILRNNQIAKEKEKLA